MDAAQGRGEDRRSQRERRSGTSRRHMAFTFEARPTTVGHKEQLSQQTANDFAWDRRSGEDRRGHPLYQWRRTQLMLLG